ncbi:hypothetical protein ACFP9V_00780 [Deinococcus radiopugnans]|uniref:Ig-like domain-containing protein n=1 Tax=Deinococcus radiopugnans ATCC 19172 TaxID=585398 RepID=A0A5C4Y0H2_9DEIO|nr:hypothetical protein [Deinococcus radiopugnans]MBB6017917.1 hypothetical protein [Deinococcus radiopugnans ATCC 19172]TNM68975.1 hypothetical protein FHR04_15600 [Deinococcus radiopugnans ATCC 19172]
MFRRAFCLPALLCVLALPLSLGLSGCRYNFVPLLPPVVAPNLPVRVTEATLKRDGDTLIVTARVDGRFEPGYLSVNWFDSGRALGSDSVYLDAEQRAATFRLTAPDEGAYRAVLSFGGAVLRQVELYEVQP